MNEDNIIGFLGDQAERDQRRRSSALTVSMYGGSTAYLFNTSVEDASRIFEEHFPDVNFEIQHGLHSSIAGTTVDLIITGVSLGAGIVATEFLKECGKDLWKVFRKLILAKDDKFSSTSEQRGLDNLSVTIHIDDSSVKSTLGSLGRGSEKRVEQFLTKYLLHMYNDAATIIGKRGKCADCVEIATPVTGLPCRYCVHQGSKLRIVANNICDLNGARVTRGIEPTMRKKSFYNQRKDA